jgi:hypothetical protein
LSIIVAVTSPLQPVFLRLREVLAGQRRGLTVAHDSAERYSLEAPIGPATLEAWGGRVRTPAIPVAWVEVRKAYVSYHLMGISGNQRRVARGRIDCSQRVPNSREQAYVAGVV